MLRVDSHNPNVLIGDSYYNKNHKIAEWQEDGKLHLYDNKIYEEEMLTFTNFVNAGKPKRKWCITKTFLEKPVAIIFPPGTGFVDSELTDKDLEEFFE